MASLADIRTGLRANLLAAGFLNVNAYTLPSPQVPCFEIDLDPEGAEYDMAFNRGLDTVYMIVRAVHPQGLDHATQVALDTYIDGAAGTDVKTALEADPSLGGAAQAIHVTGVMPRRYKSDTTGDLLMCLEWRVTVYCTGSS